MTVALDHADTPPAPDPDPDRTRASFEEFFPGMDVSTLDGITKAVWQNGTRFSPFGLRLPPDALLAFRHQLLQNEWRQPERRGVYLASNLGLQQARVQRLLGPTFWSKEVYSFFWPAGHWMLPLAAFMDLRVVQLTWLPCARVMRGVLVESAHN